MSKIDKEFDAVEEILFIIDDTEWMEHDPHYGKDSMDRERRRKIKEITDEHKQELERQSDHFATVLKDMAGQMVKDLPDFYDGAIDRDGYEDVYNDAIEESATSIINTLNKYLK